MSDLLGHVDDLTKKVLIKISSSDFGTPIKVSFFKLGKEKQRSK